MEEGCLSVRGFKGNRWTWEYVEETDVNRLEMGKMTDGNSARRRKQVSTWLFYLFFAHLHVSTFFVCRRTVHPEL